MSFVQTGQISAFEEGQTRKMSTVEKRHYPVSTFCSCLVSAADICPVSTADICPVSTEDIFPVPTGALLVQDKIFQTPKTNLASHGREEFGQATPRAEFKTDAAM